MRIARVLVLALLAVFTAAPAAAQQRSQERERPWWSSVIDRVEREVERTRREGARQRSGDDDRWGDDDRDDDDDDRWDDDDRDDDRYDRRDRRWEQRGQPPFCRNGQGHPVFGLEWCRDRARDREDRRDRQDRRDRDGGWENVGWEDVIFGPRDDRDRRDRRRDRDRRLDEREVVDVLGEVVLGRMVRATGSHGDLDGRWVDLGSGRGQVLQLRAGGLPLAELGDRNGDGRAETVLLFRP